MKISRRVSGIKISAIKEMPLIASQVEGCVSLGQGVPSFATPPHIVAAVHQALTQEDWAGKYSLQPGMVELRRAVAEYLARERGLEYDPLTEIGITVGAMEGLLTAFLTLVDQGDEVLVPDPTYEPHLEQIRLAQGTPVFVPLNSGDWGLDPELYRAAVTPNTKALVLCNPANPTGKFYTDWEVRALTRLARQHDLFIISDETYEHLVYDGPGPLAPASLSDVRDRVVTVGSFSKKYAMTGWRVGYVAAPAEIMAQLMKVHDSAAICAPTPSQVAALAALAGPQDVVAEMKGQLAQRRDLICHRLDRLSAYFSYIRPQGAYYLLARYSFTDDLSRDLAVRLIREARVITIPGSSFGPGGEGHLRLSYGGEPEEINEAFDRLEMWLEGV